MALEGPGGGVREGWFLPTLPLTGCDFLRRIVFLIFRTKRLIPFGPKCTWSSGLGKPLLCLPNTGFKKPNWSTRLLCSITLILRLFAANLFMPLLS